MILRGILLLVFIYNVSAVYRSHAGIDPCSPTPCGINTYCRVRDDRTAECRCKDGFFPNPDTIQGCKPQCFTDGECPSSSRCAGNNCVQLCSPNPCGLNAVCEGRDHRAVCRCVSGYVGNPSNRCYPEEPPRARAIIAHNPCSPSPCGSNAECRNRGDRPVCSCPIGYQGDPYTGCIRGECTANEHCPPSRSCHNFNCVNPCSAACGTNSECDVRNHVAICRCPRGYKGDPFSNCRRFDPEELCLINNPCGTNTNCRVENERAICSCKPGYEGSPITGCRRECESDFECSGTQSCIDYKCRNPCSNACGQYANCDVRNHKAVCTCPPDYLGNALTRCYPECTDHSECPNHRSCQSLKCVDPCVGSCGINAQCRVENHKAICSCPKGYTGHPFDRCRPFEPQDLCIPNPCGSDAKCTPGHDTSGKERPVCTCPSGYYGNALVSCIRGECESDAECPNHRACYSNYCKNPCDGNCGINARCEPHNHSAVCTCNVGYTGDPLARCYPDHEHNRNNG